MMRNGGELRLIPDNMTAQEAYDKIMDRLSSVSKGEY